MIRVSKDIVIASLKEFFAKDSYYHYVKDEWGFAKTPSHLDLPTEAGLNDDLTTRLYIGEKNRYDAIYYPAIIVESGSWRNVPISMSRNQYVTEWKAIEYVDGYGNSYLKRIPDKFVLSGAWEGSLSINVMARGLKARDDLIELCAIFFSDLRWSEFYKSGIAIKPSMSIGGPGESSDYNENLYKQSITLEIRTEWKREIPINDLVEMINICVEFGNIETKPEQIAPNLTVNTYVDLLDELNGLSDLSGLVD